MNVQIFHNRFLDTPVEESIGESGIDPFKAAITKSSLDKLTAKLPPAINNVITPKNDNNLLNLKRKILNQKSVIEELNRKYCKTKTQYNQTKVFITNLFEHLQIKTPSFKQDLSKIDVSAFFETEDEPRIDNPVLSDLNSNELCQKHSRHYSEFSKNFWSGVGLRSPATLEFIGNVLKVPCMKTISRFTEDAFQRKLNCIMDLNQFHLELEAYKLQYNTDEPIFGTLSVDAVSTTSNLSTEERESIRSKLNMQSFGDSVNIDIFLERINSHNKPIDAFYEEVALVPTLNQKPNVIHYKYLFVFYFQPFRPEYKPLIVYVEKSKDGKATNSWAPILTELSKKMKTYGIIPLINASDGDNGYDQLFINNFQKLRHMSPQNLLDFDFNFPIMATDILHFLKNARSKLINNLISPSIRQQSLINFPLIKLILCSLKKDVWDPAPLSKMVDIFPIQIFTIENCIKLFNNQKIPETIYFSFFSFLREGILNCKLSLDQRSQLFEIGMIFSVL